MISNQLIKSLFVVISIGLILTVYEYSLFYLILVPQIKKDIYKSLNYNTNKNSEVNNEENNTNSLNLFSIFNETIVDYYFNIYKPDSNNNILLDLEYSYKERENRLIKSINNYTVFAAVLMIFLLISVLFLLRYVLVKNNSDIGKEEIISIIFTLIIIFILQGIFYKYGQNYKYPNNISVLKKVYGDNIPSVSAELKLAVYDKIKN